MRAGLQGSQRQLTHVGREQVRLLNRWTHAFARRVAQETDAPPANVPPVTLAAAEAPYSDPFLMEFEDQTALNQAYSEAPMTFEQALLAARLEAKQAAEVPNLVFFRLFMYVYNMFSLPHSVHTVTNPRGSFCGKSWVSIVLACMWGPQVCWLWRG